jgi:mRNA interferase MazF
MVEVTRGDIIYADLRGGIYTNISGVIPVLIIQNDIANKYAPTVIVAPLIPDTKSSKLPTHVHISADQSGLEIDSSKIKDWIIGGIVGALFGIIASFSLGL